MISFVDVTGNGKVAGGDRMKPVVFSCSETIALAPTQIAEQILDMSRWPEFNGFGPLPGIESAELEVRTPEVIGSRIRVKNRDGSSHVEEIVIWDPERRLQLRMQEFSKPVSRLAKEFLETWELQREGNGTRVIRSMELHAISVSSKLVLWFVSFFLKQAIARNLRDIAGKALVELPS